MRSSHSDKASQITNIWAEKRAEYMACPIAQSSREREFVNAELQVAKQELMAAEEEVSRFRAETGLGEVSGGLDPFPALETGAKDWRPRPFYWQAIEWHRTTFFCSQAGQEMKEGGGTISDLPLQLLNVDVIIDRGQLSAELIREQGGDIDITIATMQKEERIIFGVIDTLSASVLPSSQINRWAPSASRS